MLHEEFKRRIKTPTVLPSAETAAMLFWAGSPQVRITMRKVDGWHSLTHKLADKPIDLAARPPILIQSGTAPIKFQHKSRRHRLTLLSQCEESAEIGIGRNENAAFITGALEDLAVCCSLQTVIAYMGSVVPSLSQLLREYRGQSIVHEELHGIVNGGSRSRTASAG
jgi:hypothetical protein